MESQLLINWVFGAAGTAIGWILKILWDSIVELKREMRQIERDLPEVYARRDDLKEEVRELREDLRAGLLRIEGTLVTMSRRLDRSIPGEK